MKISPRDEAGNCKICGEAGRCQGHKVKKPTREELILMIRRLMPWVGKAIAEGIYEECAMPNDAIQALNEAQALLETIKVLKRA